MEVMALFAILDALLSSNCCASMLGCILEERRTTIPEKIGMPARVTKARFQEV